MTFDDLRTPWQETNGGATSPQRREELVAHVCRRVERLGAAVVRRDVIETVAAGFVVIAFTPLFFVEFGSVLVKLGAATVIASAFYIVYRLHRTRADWTRSSLDASVREFCRVEMHRLDRQVELLRSVLWWYISPAIIGVNLVVLGIDGVGWFSVAYGLATLLFAWWVYHINQKAVDQTLIPVRNQLAGMLEELGEMT